MFIELLCETWANYNQAYIAYAFHDRGFFTLEELAAGMGLQLWLDVGQLEACERRCLATDATGGGFHGRIWPAYLEYRARVLAPGTGDPRGPRNSLLLELGAGGGSGVGAVLAGRSSKVRHGARVLLRGTREGRGVLAGRSSKVRHGACAVR